MRRKKKQNNKIKVKIFIVLLSIIFVLGILYTIYYFYDVNKAKQDTSNVQNELNSIEINEQEITPTKTERMLQLEELQKTNSDIVAWIEIEGTNINYPILHTSNNDYYLTHNYKKEYVSSGSLFLDKDFDLNKPSTNYLIYGHRNKQGLMFEDLLKYDKEDFYKAHSNIKFTTTKEDSIYEIIAVFYSRVYYKSEQNVFRYYYFINAENEQEFNNYINNSKTASIYDTGKTAEYGDQLLTLSTCEYSKEDGRFVVVARKIGK
jgi:SrtB family sortase